MLITSEVEIEINGKNKKYYSSLGYDINNNFIKVKISDLYKNSQKIVDCKCDDCQKDLKMTYQRYNKGIEKNNKTICKKCIKKYIINPFSKNDVKDKIKLTLIEKYGVDSPLKNKDIKNKKNKTMINKYGYSYSFDNKDIDNKRKNKINKRTNDDKKIISDKIKNNTDYIKSREKFEKTMLNKYGVLNALQNETIKKSMILKINNKTIKEKKLIKDRIKKRNLEIYGLEHPSKSDEFKNKSKNTKRKNSILKFLDKHKNFNILDIDYDNGQLKAYCEKHGEYFIGFSAFYHRFNDNHNMCTICNKLGSYTKTENELLDFIKENYNSEILIHNRKILNNEYEIDIFLPNLNLAFEFNGLFWHSELYKSNNYHLNKTELCEKNNIHLIHIYEDDWLYKQDIVKSRVLNLLGKSNKIYARKCEIKEIKDNKITREFLNKNHIQGFVGSSIKIGLFYNKELVSIMTFGNFRKPLGQKSQENSYELLRFCNKLNTNVIGGASKLFKHFIKIYKPNQIISYADRSWSQGKLYEKLGFKLIHKTKPNYYYIIDGIRKHRFGFRKDILIKNGDDKNKTEHQIMLEKKIYRLYDSGNLKFKYNLSIELDSNQ